MKKKTNGGKKLQVTKNTTIKGQTPATNTDALQTAVANLLQDQLKNIFNPNTPQRPGLASKRRMSDSDSESDDGEGTSTGGNIPKQTPMAKKAKPTNNQSTNATYSSQVVILEGVHDNLKSNPQKFLKALRSLKPELQIKSVRKTASGAMLIVPKEPKDCNSLLKADAFQPNSVLGPNVTARLPKAQTITHQVIIKNIDTEVTEEEVKEMLQRQELPFVDVKRIWSRQRNAPTEMMRLILKEEGKKNMLLKNGIFLDQMHFKCVRAKEEVEAKLAFQCWNCQKWNDHKTNECKNATKCVICAGDHRKSDCTKQKSEAVCSNCGGNHAAWSTDCPTYQAEIAKKKSYAKVAVETVSTSHMSDLIKPLIKEVLTMVKNQIAVIVAEVLSRAFLDHVFWERESRNSGGERHLSASNRITSLAKWSVQAVNAAPLHSLDEHTVETNDVLLKVMGRLQNVLSTPASCNSSFSQETTNKTVATNKS